MHYRTYLHMLSKGWWIIAITALSAMVITLILTYAQTPLYRARARLIISPNSDITSGRDEVSSLATLDRRSIAATFAEVLSSDQIYAATRPMITVTPAELSEYQLSAVVLPAANVLELTVSGPDPQLAATIANSVGQQGIEYIQNLYQVYTLSFLDLAKIPTQPFSPQPLRDASLALFLGAVFGVALVLLRDHLGVPWQAIRQRQATDPISLAYTRSYIIQRLETAAASNNDISLGVVQLNGLQEMIETLPLPVLQQVLRQATTIFREEVRSIDSVGRWNDTSFAVILPHMSGPDALTTLERICQRLSNPLNLNQDDTILLRPHAAVIEQRRDRLVSTTIEQVEQALKNTHSQDSRPILLSPEIQTAVA